MHANSLVAIIFALVGFSTSLVAGNPIKVANCSNIKEFMAEVNSVDVSGCEKQPCIFHKGTTVNCTVTLTPKEEISSGELEVYAYIGGTKVPFPLPEPKACKDHGLSCPLKKGETVKLFISFPVKQIFPSIELVVQFDMKDQNDKYAYCIKFSAAIQFEEREILVEN